MKKLFPLLFLALAFSCKDSVEDSNALNARKNAGKRVNPSSQDSPHADSYGYYTFVTLVSVDNTVSNGEVTRYVVDVSNQLNVPGIDLAIHPTEGTLEYVNIVSHDSYNTWTATGGNITACCNINNGSFARISFDVRVPADRVQRNISLVIYHYQTTGTWTDDLILTNNVNPANISDNLFTNIPLGRTYSLTATKNMVTGVAAQTYYSTDQINWTSFSGTMQVNMGSYYFKSVYTISGSQSYKYSMQLSTPPTTSPSQSYQAFTATGYSPSIVTIQTYTPWHYPIDVFTGAAINFDSSRGPLGGGGPR